MSAPGLPWPTVATRLGVGGGPFGGLFTHVPEAEVVAAVERAWSLGIRLFDVAPFYGHGRAERLVGGVLSQLPRDQFALSTKVGRVLRRDVRRTPSSFVDADDAEPVFDFSAAGVYRSLTESLERLGLDRVDVAYIHDPEDHLDQALAEALPSLEELRAEGLVGATGVGTNFAETLARFAREATIDCALLAGRFTLLDRSGGDVALPLCAERGIAVVVGGVFNSGLLADGTGTFDYAPAPSERVAEAQRLAAICEQFDVSLSAAALQFPFTHPAVVSVVVGVRGPQEVEANVAAFEKRIPPELWERLAHD